MILFLIILIYLVSIVGLILMEKQRVKASGKRTTIENVINSFGELIIICFIPVINTILCLVMSICFIYDKIKHIEI
jgi:predicted permease